MRAAIVARRVSTLGLVVLLALLAPGGLRAQTAQTQQVMRQKLEASRQALGGLVKSDWTVLGKSTRALAALTMEPGWAVLREPEYAKNTVEFLRSVDALTAAANRRDQTAALSAYTGLVTSCVRCHQYVARARIAGRHD